MTTTLSEETLLQIKQLIVATREVSNNIKQTNKIIDRILEPSEKINELANTLERYDKLKTSFLSNEQIQNK